MIPGSNPVIGKFYSLSAVLNLSRKDENTEKEAGNGMAHKVLGLNGPLAGTGVTYESRRSRGQGFDSDWYALCILSNYQL